MNVRGAVLISALLLAACGSETSTDTGAPAAARPAPAAPRDVCGMLTMDELKTAAEEVPAVSVQVMSATGDANTSKGEATAVAHVILGKL